MAFAYSAAGPTGLALLKLAVIARDRLHPSHHRPRGAGVTLRARRVRGARRVCDLQPHPGRPAADVLGVDLLRHSLPAQTFRTRPACRNLVRPTLFRLWANFTAGGLSDWPRWRCGFWADAIQSASRRRTLIFSSAFYALSVDRDSRQSIHRRFVAVPRRDRPRRAALISRTGRHCSSCRSPSS